MVSSGWLGSYTSITVCSSTTATWSTCADTGSPVHVSRRVKEKHILGSKRIAGRELYVVAQLEADGPAVRQIYHHDVCALDGDQVGDIVTNGS